MSKFQRLSLSKHRPELVVLREHKWTRPYFLVLILSIFALVAAYPFEPHAEFMDRLIMFSLYALPFQIGLIIVPTSTFKLTADLEKRLLIKSTQVGIFFKKKIEIPFDEIRHVSIVEEYHNEDSGLTLMISFRSRIRGTQFKVHLVYNDEKGFEEFGVYPDFITAKTKADALAKLLDCRVQNKVLGGIKV